MKTTLSAEHLIQWAAEIREERDDFVVVAERHVIAPGLRAYVDQALSIYDERIRIIGMLVEEALAE